MISIRDLKKSYNGEAVLTGINLQIGRGEIFGFAGRSGTGKSTLLRCINGIETFDSGSLMVDGTEVRSLEEGSLRSFRREIGMIFQNFSLMERASVYDNIALPMRCWHYDKKEVDRKVRELLDVVGMPEKIHARARELSGGQKQRVAIARALTMNPKVLLCDEATSALDPKSTASIMDLLGRINRELGITIIVVSHEMGVLRSICKNIAILENGVIEAQGTVEKIFKSRPAALLNLLGGHGFHLPETGRNLEIIYSKYNNHEPILSRMARELDVDFSIVGSDNHNYGDESMTSYIINLDPAKLGAVAGFLDANKMLWHEIETLAKEVPDVR